MPRPLKLIVQNIVSNAQLGGSVNCELVSEALHARLNHKVFPALTSHCKDTKTTICCFASGQIVVSESRDELQSLLSCYLFIARINRDLNRSDLQLENFTVANIVCSCYLGYKLNVDAFVQANKKFCEYEPESFPGAHWRTYSPNIGFVLFQSGHVACIGLKSYDQIEVARQRLQLLEDFEEGCEKRPFDGTKRRQRVRTTNIKKLAKLVPKPQRKPDSAEFFEQFMQQLCPKLVSMYAPKNTGGTTAPTASQDSLCSAC